MNSSRAMLLAALMFAAPVLANEPQAEETSAQVQNVAPEAPAVTETPATENPTWFAAKLAALSALGTKAVDYTVTPVANWTTMPVLSRIPYIKDCKHVSTFGKAIVVAGAAAVAYKLYNAINEQDVDGDDEDFNFDNN